MYAKFSISLMLALLLLLLGSSGFAQQGSRSDIGSDSSLWIEVVDARGAPLKDACVVIVPREGEILFRRADGRGRVRVKRLTRGHYRVTAKVDGYEAQKKEVELETQTSTVSFTLQPRNQ